MVWERESHSGKQPTQQQRRLRKFLHVAARTLQRQNTKLQVRSILPRHNFFCIIQQPSAKLFYILQHFSNFGSIGRDFMFILLIPTPLLPLPPPSHNCHLISQCSPVRCNEGNMNFSSCRLLYTEKRCNTARDFTTSKF